MKETTMPYTKKVNGESVRDYKRQYEKYDGKPNIVKDRAQRNAARALLKKEGVDVAGKDVNHKKPLSKGGNNKRSNLEAVKPSKNKSFARKSNGAMK
jgi:5-methylcytosine-specific restriction endonuclease McrA